MFNILPVLLKDGYKAGHPEQYAPDTTLVYSNMTARSSRIPGINKVVPLGFQYFVAEYLFRQFRNNFFEVPRDAVLKLYKRRMDNYLGPDAVPVNKIGELHELGYLPLLIKAVPEGLRIPLRVPYITLRNTDDKFFWLTNMPETLMSSILWIAINSATIADQYRRNFDKAAKETGGDPNFVQWQGHDFSFRGMAGVEAAMISGAGHLLSFTGTDTIPAIDFLEEYYGADAEKELVGGSVPATEHSVMCMGGASKAQQRALIKRLITEVYPKGIVSIVCDTWDFWEVITQILPSLKAEIMARDGKVVVRPDSGDPADIICGTHDTLVCGNATHAGAVATLATRFGATRNQAGYMQLDPHIGLIYGDSISLARQVDINTRLKNKGFASTNWVAGIGSFTYQYNTRDTFGQAVKATYGATVSEGERAIYKDPKTDDGTKKSATGLLRVRYDAAGNIVCDENCTWDEEAQGLLRPIFHNGNIHNFDTLANIRARLAAQREQE